MKTERSVAYCGKIGHYSFSIIRNLIDFDISVFTGNKTIYSGTSKSMRDARIKVSRVVGEL